MAFEFILPDIGEGVVEAEIQHWFVKPGDEVHEDQALVEVMTDKATVTIPSPRRGRVLRLHYEEGQIARVHEPLLEIEVDSPARPERRTEGAESKGEGGVEGAESRGAGAESRGDRAEPGRERVRSAASVEEPTARATPSQAGAAVAPPPGKALATPAVRAMARQLGIDVSSVHGSGPGGRVTKDDLRQARNGHAEPLGEEVPAGGGEPAPRPPARGDEIVPVRGIRRRIAQHMAESKRTAAHFTFVEQVDVTELVKVKERIATAARDEGIKVTFLPFVVKAVVSALKKHPWLNAILDEERGEIRLRREYHVGIASATEQGLVVPVIRDADHRSLVEIAREVERLGSASKAGRLRPSDVGGSTFTITSLGALGGLFATPIINFPEVAILGVHRIRPTPVVRDGQIVARDVMHVSLSFDHRVVDGHVGAAFAYAVIRYLEDPSLLFMELV